MVLVKTVKQRDIKDCGACSLSSIISYYGGYVPIEKIRLDTNTNKDGTDALNIINAAKKYGFDAMGIKIENFFNNQIKLPAIAHVILKNNLEHFVVIYKITKKQVYLMDPAQGKIKMSINEFMKIWSKVILIFTPKIKIMTFSKNNTLLKSLLHLLCEEKKLLIIIFITSLILTFITILGSYYFKVVIDFINIGSGLDLLTIIIISFFIITILKLILANLRNYLENYLNKNIDCKLISSFINHLFHLPIDFIRSRTSGEIISRVQDLINVKSLITNIIISGILDFFLIMLSLPFLYKINKTLFLILLVIVIIYIVVSLIYSKILYKKAYQNIEKKTKVSSNVIENINLLSSIKNLNNTNNILLNTEKIISEYLYDNFKLIKFINKDSNLKFSIFEIGLFIINTIGFYLFFNQKLGLTDLITFNTLIMLFLDPLKRIVSLLPKYNFLKASIVKINEFLSVEKEHLGPNQKLLGNNIKIENLTFSYNNYNLILDNFNFYISSGDFVLLKGSSGKGKSTICKLILKYFDNYKGNILLGDKDIKDYSINTIRNNIVYISQSEALFTGTITENIKFYRDVSDEKFKKICKMCYIDKMIIKHPLRYETIINNETSFISGGEKQRIILARGLIKEGEIYLIDEALSEVDYNMEKMIILNLKQYLKNKTVVYITHKNQDKLFSKIMELS